MAKGPVDAERELRIAVGERVRAARTSAGLTLREVAGSLEVSAGTWSAVENGLTRIRPERLEGAASLFGTTSQALLGDAPSGPSAETSWRDFGPLDLPPPLAGALEAFVEVGYAGASIRDIAGRAGLSVAGIYHHWPTKQDLLVALLDLTMEDLLRRSRTARAEGDGPVERFAALVECLALFHTHRRDLGFIGASEMRSLEPHHRARIAGLRHDMQRMVDDEVTAGRRRRLMATDLPRESARAVVTLCTALPQWWLPTGPATPETIAGQYVDFALDLVRASR